MKTIKLTHGYEAVVDDEDYEMVNAIKWYPHKRPSGCVYAVGWMNKKNISMHRLILNPPKHLVCDHLNGDGLDNRRCNIRTVTHLMNMHSFLRKPKNCSSKFKGVSWDKHSRKWCVRIRHCGIRYCAGLFHDEKIAAMAYNSKILELGRGESAMNQLW